LRSDPDDKSHASTMLSTALVTRSHAMIEAGFWTEVRLAKVSALAQSSTRVRLRGIVPARISLAMGQDIPLNFLVSFSY
jgi:hypothetical protein